MSAQEALDTLLPGTPERERGRQPSERSDVSGERRGSLDVARDSILAIERAAQAEPEPEPEPELTVDALLAELEPGPAFEVGQTLYAMDPKREGTLLCNGPSEESGFKKSGRNSPGALKQEDLRIPDDAEVTLKGVSEDRLWGEIWLAEGGGQTGWIPLRNLSSRRHNRAAAVSSQPEPEPEPEPGKARVTLQNVAAVKQRTGHVVAELQVRTIRRPRILP